MEIVKLSSFILLLVFFTSCSSEPSSIKSLPEDWVVYYRNVDNGDDSIEVLEDSYIFLGTHVALISRRKKIKWGWKMELQNNLETESRVRIKYILKDKHGFPLEEDIESVEIPLQSTVTIQHTGILRDVKEAKRVSESTWELKFKDADGNRVIAKPN